MENPYTPSSLPIEKTQDWTGLLLLIDIVSMVCAAAPTLLFIYVRFIQPEHVSDQTLLLTGFAIFATILLCVTSGLYNLARAVFRCRLGYLGLALNAISGGLVLYLLFSA